MKHNSIKSIIEKYFEEGVDTYLPQLSINCVVLGYAESQLKVLVNQLPDSNSWMLPGGYVKKTENVDEAAYRNLKLSGIDEVFLKQIQIFGEVSRVPEFYISDIGEMGVNREIIDWANKRFVTIVFYGLVNLAETEVVRGGLLNEFKWVNVDHLEKMFMDHAEIIMGTRKILSTEILNRPVLSSLMPKTFTLTELRGLFESVLDRKIDRGTFRRKMLKLGIIEQVDERKENRGQLSHIFKINENSYKKFIEEQTKYGF